MICLAKYRSAISLSVKWAMALSDLTIGKTLFGEMTFGKLTIVGKLTFGEMAFDQMPISEVTFGKTPFGEMAFGESLGHIHIIVNSVVLFYAVLSTKSLPYSINEYRPCIMYNGKILSLFITVNMYRR